MGDLKQYGALATRLAALQQGVLLEGGLTPPSLPLVANPCRPAARPEGYARPASSLGAAAPILIGASKTQPVEMLEAAIRLGLRDFGENKVQEAQAKWPELKARYPDVRLHLIGPLQSNKAREAVALFDVIQTVDRPKIADALAEACAKEGRRPAMLIQVNIGEEPQKSGVMPTELADLLRHCNAFSLPITGLMCVPPADHNPAPYFALMQKLAKRHGLAELSMGMSSDYEVALRLGATMIRVGTALFGERIK